MSACSRVLVLGTGTGIGKTEVSRALVRGRAGTIGLKPIESGLSPEQMAARSGSDGERIRHGTAVPAAPYLFPEAVSPHLAARYHGVAIDLRRLASWLDSVHEEYPGRVLVVESAGGAFSPLGADLFNADLIGPCRFDRVVLVAANRLGVLHDVFATCLALRSRTGRVPDCVVLNDATIEEADPLPRTTNLDELRELGRALGLGAVVRFPRDGSAADALPIWSALAR